MSQQRSIEVKVGVLILVALGLLGGFIVVMGGLSFESTYRVNVEFENPGGLQPGAPVRLSGMRVGRIAAIEFRGTDPQALASGSLIRVVAELEKNYQPAIFENARWFVSTQGVLGEFFLAIEPGTPDRPMLQDGAVVQGVSPPRLDLLLSEAYELLHHAYLGITRNEAQLRETFDGLHKTLIGSGHFFERNTDKIDRLVDNLERLSIDANDALLAARARYVDNPKILSTIDNLERTSSKVNEDLGPLLHDARGLMNDLSRISAALGSEPQLARYEQITRQAQQLTTDASSAAADARLLMAHVKAGKGTVGAMLSDEAVYDDLQELLRDLKNNPWKLFWRE
jgi:phospholipid/cholesterol/gamma-HCH transport system substrate-binding protein